MDFRTYTRGISAQIKHMVNRDVGVLLAVTISVQGLVIGGQLLVAFVVSPEELGAIRWLESAFAILLIAASCGIPSIAFREAALCSGPVARSRLFRRSVFLPLVLALLVIFVGTASYFRWASEFHDDAWLYLLAASGVLLPANTARVGIAIIQGAQVARLYWRWLVVVTLVGVAVLVGGGFLHGLRGWIAGRYLVEFGLAMFVAIALIRRDRQHELDSVFGIHSSWQALFKVGASANLALMTRVLSDNLPILLLKAYALRQVELGWFGFAGLILFAPLLLMSVLMHHFLPSLVMLHKEPEAFRYTLGNTNKALMLCAVLGALCVAFFALLIHFVASQSYADSAPAILLLAVTLPFRARIMTAGSALVAHGQYGTALALNLLEVVAMLILMAVFKADTATTMAAVVLCNTIISAVVFAVLINRKEWLAV